MTRYSHPLHLLLGLIVWSVWFVVLYGGLSVACAVAPPEAADGALTWLNGLVLIAALLVFAGLLGAAWRCWNAASQAGGEQEARLTAQIGAGVYLLSAVASLALGLPGMVLPPCL